MGREAWKNGKKMNFERKMKRKKIEMITNFRFHPYWQKQIISNWKDKWGETKKDVSQVSKYLQNYSYFLDFILTYNEYNDKILIWG